MGQSILLGVSGGIAAYKSVDLVRRLRENAHTVRVVMTQAAQSFVTPLTFQAVSGYPVGCDLLDAESEAAMDHISLARFAEKIIIAPASADVIARLAQGMANDLLTAICLATTAPIAIVPAMNHRMWHNPITQANVAKLQQFGYAVWGPDEGTQACGEYGLGRMLEPEAIVTHIENKNSVTPLHRKTIVITAGPTREPLDPVRFISNRSSGKMGYALAAAAAQSGAKVILISGPTALAPPKNVQLISIETATQMYETVMQQIPQCDIFIGAAAVADFRPTTAAPQKSSKNEFSSTLSLTANPDIIRAVAQFTPKPLTIGFAAETHDVKLHAMRKWENKGLDAIIANQVGLAEGGFDSDVNSVELYSAEGMVQFPRQSKIELAHHLIEWISNYYGKQTKDSIKNIG
ncbi:MAG: coaBC [Gammaproteobacteria bacterium]|jgi:phosphopantothenoylcysteine decarboxylase/phosphopantothenate--cysteine ligase|nr:coaBC [Gammaproteobacteria bacterium]